MKVLGFLKRHWFLLTVIVLIGLSVSYREGSALLNQGAQQGDISRVVQLVSEGKVGKVIVSGNQLIAELKEKDEQGNNKITAYKEERISLTDYGLTPDKVTIEVKDSSGRDLWLNIIFSILPLALMIGFFYMIMRQAQGAQGVAMQVSRTNARVTHGSTGVTFADVAGNDEAKRELEEVVDFLKNPKKYHDLGASIPKGVLLLGNPGTGKTLLAKAVAGEANVPFFSISGSEFVEMFVGVGAGRVRDLFKNARAAAPAIIFIDEIDAVGRRRGSGMGGGHDEREQTLNQILVELDGFDPSTNVIVLAATNRPDVLDPALLRPGRFDRHVTVDLPDIKGREAILAVHAKGKPFVEGINLKNIAQKTAGFSGADLKNVLNEGAILTAREDRSQITQADLTEAIEKVMMGPERRSKVIPEKDRQITAYHEAGHALVAHFAEHADPVQKISIVSRGRALGYTWNPPEQDVVSQSQAAFEDDIAVMLAGREAELIIFNEKTTGASNDLMKASEMARKMVIEYGMSDAIGPVSFYAKDDMNYLGGRGADHRSYSHKTAELIDQEVEKIILNGQKKAHQILTKYAHILETLSQYLLKEEIIERPEFEALIERELKKA